MYLCTFPSQKQAQQHKQTMMISPAQSKVCGICLASLPAAVQGQSIFTGGCSHSFHFPCISPTLFSGNPVCPLCYAPWNVAPQTPSNPFVFTQFPSQPFSPEPLHFSDDDPLLDVSSDPVSSDGVESLAITGIPERAAVAASESVSLFTVLVGVKAPALSDARVGSRAPIDLVTVLDVSGSMFGSKLALVKRAVHFVIDNLGPSDRLSIVSFSSRAKRIMRLCRMSKSGREEAKKAVDWLMAEGGTNIVDGLKKGVQVLEGRRQANPVSSIIFLSDGNDTCHHQGQGRFFQTTLDYGPTPGYLHLLPVSIRPINNNNPSVQTIPVHSFGFGSDHDPVAMHAISDASGGTFSFIESYEAVQDAFAGCIGGLLSVVAQEVCLNIRSASNGVKIKSIPSGRYRNEIIDNESGGAIHVGDMYADEHKEFLINVSVPPTGENEKTSLLDIMCSYKDVASMAKMHVEGELVEIQRPQTPSLTEMMVNLAIDRQRNRVVAAEAISEAQQMAETGNLLGARSLLARKRSDIMGSAAGQAGDGLCVWLEADMKETEMRMENQRVYQQAGRAYALSGMSSHGFQRATMKGGVESVCFAAVPQCSGYATPNMVNMVYQSQQQRKKEGEGLPQKDHEN